MSQGARRFPGAGDSLITSLSRAGLLGIEPSCAVLETAALPLCYSPMMRPEEDGETPAALRKMRESNPTPLGVARFRDEMTDHGHILHIPPSKGEHVP